MSRPLEDALINALDLLEQGETVEQILAHHPETAAQLRPYLLAAAGLSATAVAAPASVRQASKENFLQYAEAMQTRPRLMAGLWLRRTFSFALAALLLILGAGALLTIAANETLPGDTLYGAKLFVETVRLDLNTDPQAAVKMVERLRQERVEEVAALIAADRREAVTVRGALGERIPTGWLLEEIPVTVTNTTAVHGALESGFVVEVTGMTGDGVLTAALIEVISGRLPQADQEPLPVVPTLPVTPQPSATPQPAATPEWQLTLTPTSPTPPTPTIPLTVTMTPAEAEDSQTVVPQSDNGADDQSDDHGDDSSSHGDDKTPEAEGDRTSAPSSDDDQSSDHSDDSDHGDDSDDSDHGDDSSHNDDKTPEADHD
jgi:hypothetical protein